MAKTERSERNLLPSLLQNPSSESKKKNTCTLGVDTDTPRNVAMSQKRERERENEKRRVILPKSKVKENKKRLSIQYAD